MRTHWLKPAVAGCIASLLAACSASSPRPASMESSMTLPPIHSFRADGDLLTAGLGLDGLRSTTPPAFADPAHPTAIELRRRAIWSNWRGIADLAPGGGYGELYGSLAAVPGTEHHALLRLPDAHQPHRVMLQLPDQFDAARRCLLVAASSGSRGIYGAIALAGAWGLPRGCAVVYTDKGAGTDWIDTTKQEAQQIDGRLAARTAGDEDAVAFSAAAGRDDAHRVAYKHAHSQDNPEADWGRHVRQAAEFGLQALSRARPDLEPFTFDDTRVIAVGLSNGGGAVLRAAELEGDWLHGVVAIAPNILAGDGMRALYDYSTEAALFMPCALLDARFDAVALARPGGAKSPASLQRCAAIAAAGLLDGTTIDAQARNALERMHASGWTDAAIEAGALSVAFDLWRAIAAGYASAYSRTSADAMPCGYSYAGVDAQGLPRATTPEERAAWWSDTSGIPPAAGVLLIDSMASGDDRSLPGLRCLRALWEGADAAAKGLQRGVASTRAALPRTDLPLIVVHGVDDGLVPEIFSGGAYVAWANANGRDVRYWRVSNAQHFDAFLGLPPLATRYVPLLPYAYRALDAMWAHIQHGSPLPASARIDSTPRALAGGSIEPLAARHLALP